MTITPDTKDWTWVLESPCAECGFDAGSVAARDVAARVRATVPVWLEALAREDATARPRPDVWSPTEYACHVRDVHRLYTQRLALMLAQDEPHFANWDQDVAAVEDRYDLQDPARVAEELGAASEAMAAAYDAVRDDQWTRTGVRGDGAHFTVDSFARYFLHDVEHHLWDVTGRSAGSWL
ncbi:MAG TPA: DinB family protein [Candidatus Angelobacter sp.]|nr:DinB family protein [Candidatus Angelobacter sp.]